MLTIFLITGFHRAFDRPVREYLQSVAGSTVQSRGSAVVLPVKWLLRILQAQVGPVEGVPRAEQPHHCHEDEEPVGAARSNSDLIS